MKGNMDTEPTKIGHHLGTTLRRLRKTANLTLEATARRTEVTKGYLSKVEHGISIPSIAVVGRLAAVYGVELSDVFMTPGHKGPFSLVRANERTLINRNGSEYGYTYEVAALNKANPRSEIFFLTLPCVDDGDLPKLRHPGEEILFVLEGKIRFDFAGTIFTLEPGDCIQFEGSYEHLGVATEGKDAKALLVITPDRHDTPSGPETAPRSEISK
jgi:transcriptional regulator with XRE-family HTH domain